MGLAAARTWCAGAKQARRILPVEVESSDGSTPQVAFALADWKDRLQRAPEAPDRTRLLCPFDPILRDRERCLRRFGFDYRFEAFVPAAKRQYGYYVLPIPFVAGCQALGLMPMKEAASQPPGRGGAGGSLRPGQHQDPPWRGSLHLLGALLCSRRWRGMSRGASWSGTPGGS